MTRMSLAEIFNTAADAYPDNSAILYFESEHKSKGISYRELQDEALQVLRACEYQRSKPNHHDCTNKSVPSEGFCSTSQFSRSSLQSQSVPSSEVTVATYNTEKKSSVTTKNDSGCKGDKNCSNYIVGVMCDPGPCSVACMLGIMQKYTYFFISPEWKENEIKSYLHRVNPNIILIEECFIDKVFKISPSTEKKIEVFGTKFLCISFTGTNCLHNFEEENIAYIILTSGSTGTPKVVYVPHKCILPNIKDFADLFMVTSKDCIFCTSPPTFDPSMVDFFVGFQAGATLVMAHMWILKMPKALLSILTKSKTTILQATPSLIFNLGKQRMKRNLLGDEFHLKILALGGEVFPKLSVLREWMTDKCKTRIFNVYGITEVSCWASVEEVFVHEGNSNNEILVPEKRESSTSVKGIPIIPPKVDLASLQWLTSIGNPLTLTVIKVLNELGKEVEEGEEGEIYVGGRERFCWVDNNNLNDKSKKQTFWKLKCDEFQGDCDFSKTTKFLKNIHTHKEDTKQKPLIMRSTGDRGISKKGKIYCLGRNDRQVKRHGKKVSLSEIERQCESLSYVENCHLILHNQIKIVAFVKTASTDVYTGSDIQNDLKSLMSDWKLPDYIITIDTIPINKHGKVDKSKLLEYFSESHLKRFGNYNCDDTGECVKELWKRILGISYVRDGENLFENENFIKSGGNSLFALQFTEEIESKFEVKIPTLLDIVLNNTFKDVLKIIIQSIECGDDYTEKQKNKKIKLQLGHKSIVNENNSESNDKICLNFEGSSIKENYSLDKYKCSLYRQVSVASRRGVHYSCEKVMHHQYQSSTHLLWKYNLEKCIDSSPTLIEYPCGKTLLMVGSHSFKFVCIDVLTGKSQWCLTLGDRIESSPCISGDGERVYVGCYDYSLYCISILTGDILWKFAANSEIKSSPVVDFETENVIFGSHDKNVYCLMSDGILVWKLKLSVGSVFSSPCIVGQQVFVATLDGVLAGINKITGNVNWRAFLHKPIFSSITAYSKGIVLGSVGGEIFGFSFTGEKLWNFKINAPVYSSAFTKVLENGLEIIAIGSHDKFVYFFNNEGHNVAKYHGESAIYSTPFIFCLNVKNKARMVVCETSGKYTLVDLIFDTLQDDISKFGVTKLKLETVHESKTRGEIFSSPVVFQNNLYICSRDDYIYCLQFV
ncbi:beta-alanine-activating enzyme [Palaemon carinicauda]|uniref:beta-alanine-activating enzyme n=1 Tax=Palaemon carinicauda TaxID=392227 RepID=UPI0035B69F3C